MAGASAGHPEVHARIVYWGIPEAGKSTNLGKLYEKLKPDHRGDLKRVPTRLDPSVSYEILPIELGEISGVRTRIEVVAPPGSLVGSIGVFAMRPVIGELLGKLGITHESMKRVDYADLLVFSRPLSDSGRARLIEEIDSLYDLFVARVAEGRGMSSEAVDQVGRGRVWTGAQAYEHGLVDELGGLRTAVRRAKLLAGLKADDDVELVIYPQPRSLTEQVVDALGQVAARASVGQVLPPVLEQLESLVRLLPPGRPLLVAPFAVEIQ